MSLAVLDEAFAAKNLCPVPDVYNVRNQERLQCTPARWKPEWLKRFIFRRFNASGPSMTEPLQYHKLKDDMVRQSLHYGYEKAIEPKVWRRGAANKANGNAPDSLRDQTMRHDPKWTTCDSAYINEEVEFHMQNAYLNEPTENALIGMLSHINVMRDPRATKDMVLDEIWDSLEPDPEIVALE